MKGEWEGGSKPCSVQEHDAWLADIQHWRSERRIRIGYSGSRYDIPALKWTQSSFMQPQMMVEDRYFYDPVAHKYRVDRYLDDLEKRYGGIDAVLIWPTYPCILGEATGTRRWLRCLITAGRCAARLRWMLIPAAPVLLASWTWWATSGSGPKNSSTSTREEASCAAEATTSRKVPSGIPSGL